MNIRDIRDINDNQPPKPINEEKQHLKSEINSNRTAEEEQYLTDKKKKLEELDNPAPSSSNNEKTNNLVNYTP
ncbi:MAG: hypothetical protein NY202_02335 [Mollicutes bacterium UO1]